MFAITPLTIMYSMKLKIKHKLRYFRWLCVLWYSTNKVTLYLTTIEQVLHLPSRLFQWWSLYILPNKIFPALASINGFEFQKDYKRCQSFSFPAKYHVLRSGYLSVYVKIYLLLSYKIAIFKRVCVIKTSWMYLHTFDWHCSNAS